MQVLKIVVDSISKSSIDYSVDIKEIEYLITITTSIVQSHKRINRKLIKEQVLDKLIDDRMDTYYTDMDIDSTIDIISRLVIDNCGVYNYNLTDYRITINEMNRLCIILKLLSKEYL